MRTPSLFELDVLASYEYAVAQKRRTPAQPERALLFAVLRDAIELLLKTARAKSSSSRALYRETEAWFLSDDESGPFSFRNICGVLEIDAHTLQRRLFDLAGDPARRPSTPRPHYHRSVRVSCGPRRPRAKDRARRRPAAAQEVT